VEPYTYITPTVNSSDRQMVRAIDGWLGLYEACYVMKKLFDEGMVVKDETPDYGQSAERPTPANLLSALLASAQALNEWGGHWVLGGGLAMNYHGRERATRDVDFFVFADKDKLQPVVDLLARHDVRQHAIERPSFMPPDAHWWWMPFQRGLPDAAPVDVDLLVADHEYMAFLHASGRESTVNGMRVRVMGPEALILLKLHAYRDQDRADLKHILWKKRNELDRDLLNAWAAKFKIEERLAEMEKQAQAYGGRRLG